MGRGNPLEISLLSKEKENKDVAHVYNRILFGHKKDEILLFMITRMDLVK